MTTLTVGAGGFASIQAAVDASQDGDTILVSAGTYVEQVVVDHRNNLLIKAAPGAQVTIQSPADVHETARSSSDREINAVFTVKASTNVVLQDIDVDGHGAGNTVDEGTGAGQANFYGVFYRNSSGGLTNVDVTGVRDPYPGGTTAGGHALVSGVQRGVGVGADNDSLLAFAMTGGSITDFQKNATVFNRADLNVSGVTITGGGAQSVMAQNGIQVANSTGTISGNTITGIGYTGASNDYAGGMLAFGNTDLHITGNTVTGANDETVAAKIVGIWVFQSGAPNSGGEISGNTISYVDEGIDVSGGIAPNGILIQNNDVSHIDATNNDPAGVYFQPAAGATPYHVDGTAGPDYLYGGSGNDTLSGLGGDDLLEGNGGNDTLAGGSGIDTALYTSPATIVQSPTGWTVTDAGGTDTLTGIEIVDDSAAGKTLLVGNGGYATIQAAIDAASDGDTILVASGTYAETLNVNKDVSILGANHGISGTAVRGAESVINGQMTINAAGATVDGFKLIGAASGSLGTTAVEVKADNFVLVNSVFDGTGDTAVITGSVGGFDFSNNLIKGYSIGVYVSGGNTAGSIHDNRFQGDIGPQTGLGNGVNSESSHLSIANNVFDGLYAGSLNLAPYGPDSVDLNAYVTGNTISHSGAARPVQIYPTDATHNIVGTDFNEAFNGDLSGATGAFTFDGRGGDDHIFGAEQADTLSGGDGNDELTGNGGNDTLAGNNGDDVISGGAGNDSEDGGAGNDTLSGDAGNDTLVGGAGIDTLNGGDDDDSLDGGSGNDTLNGGNGNDRLHGGAGNDSLAGGNGNDTAVYDGTRGDYSITMITGPGGRIVGFSAVSDNEPSNGNEGADTLTSVEILQFSNRTLDATLPVQLFDQNNQLIGTFSTIQAAIDGAQDHYTIRVAVGVFHENLNIPVAVRIIGARTTVAGRDAANGSGETTIVGHAHVTATDNVTLNGLRFLNDATTSGGGASNPTLQFQTAGGIGGHVVTNSIFWSTVAGGVPAVDDRAISITANATGSITITNDLISGSSQGLFGTASWGRGIWFDGGGATLTASGNTIEWTRTGLSLDFAGGSFASVADNNLRNLGSGFSIATTDDGLFASNNHFTNVGDDYNFRNLTDDISFNAGADGNVVPVGTGNDVVVVLGGAGNDTLTGTAGADLLDGNNNPLNPNANDSDTLTGGDGNDILLGRGGDDVLVGGAGDDLLVGGAGTDRATYTNFISASMFTPVADTDPATAGNQPGWTLTTGDGTDTLVGVEIVKGIGAAHVLLVGSGGFTTIQAAVDASQDGDTILVAAGTYIEQVVVDHRNNLLIKAVTGAQVTIQSPADVHETARSSSDREVNAVFTVKASTNVVLQGIDVDGHGAGDTVDEGSGADQANFYGIFYRNSSGALTNVDVTGVRDQLIGGQLSGVQRGVGVAADNDTLMAFAMTGGSISDFQKNATVFNHADLSINGVAITGAGASTTIAQNGLQVANSTGTISGNTITGIGYAGAANAYSGAVLAFGNTDLHITGNTITGSNGASTDAKVVGIFVVDFGTATSGGEISGNTISYVDTGIGVYADVTPNGVVIENNDITQVDAGDPYAAGVDFEPTASFATPYDVDGSAGSDILLGGGGADSLSGLGGDDFIQGNGGNDALAGDDGSDTAAYAGARSGYDIGVTTDAHGRVTSFDSVTDTDSGNGDDGSDTLTSIETLQFGDGAVTLDLAKPVQLFDGSNHLAGTFDTIQAAIDAAHNGDTIRADAGTYNEDLLVNKDVTIEGVNAGVAGDGARVAETIIAGGLNVTANGVTIDGVEITGDANVTALWPTGVYVAGNNLSLVNSILDGSAVATNGDGNNSAILTQQVTGLDVGDNLFSGFAIGVYVSGGGSTGAIHDNLFQGDGGPATGLGNGVNSETSHVAITDNIFDGLYGGVINLFPFGPDDVDLNDYVSGNTFTDNAAERPIQIYPTADSHNFTGTDQNESFRGDESGAIGPLSFDGQGGDDHAFGGADGDTFDGGTGADELHGNDGDDTLTGGAGDDLLDGGAGNDTAIVGTGAVFVPNGTGWTVTSSDGVDTLTGIEIIESGANHTLLVGSGGFTTIQAAIDAAHDGDTILVAAGTYTEQLHVDGFDGLTITAVPGATVIVKAPADLAVNASSETYGIDVRAVIAVNDSTGVDITGIKVDGSFAGDTSPGSNGDELTGIGYLNSSGAISGVEIDNVGNSQGGGLFGLQHGSGLFIDGGTTGGLNVSVTDTIITDFQKTGAIITGVTIDFTDSTISGIGGTNLTAQNGIQVFDAQGTIDHVTINEFGYTGPDYAASGIIAYEPTGSLSITDNVITGATGTTTGLDLSDVDGIHVVVTGNSFSDVDYGIAAYSFLGGTTGLDADPTISGNTFSGIEVLGVYFAPEESVVFPFTTTESFSQDGSQFADYLAGSLGDDTFNGLGGDDTLTGNGGDDMLSGGGGTDTAVYAGARDGYDVAATTDAHGFVTGFSGVTDTDAGDGDDGADTLTGIELLQFDGGAVTLDLAKPVQLFDAANQLVGTFDTIQSAVDAGVDGDTVRLEAGTYDELVTVDKDITIAGPNSGIAGTDTRGAEAVVTGFYMHAAGATLDGVEVLGGGLLAGNPAGIYVDVDNVTLTNLVVQGDGSAGTGILTPYNGGVGGLVLSDSRIDDWNNGTYFNPTTQFTATGDSFDGNGVGLTGDDWEDGTTISGNSFTNSSFGHVGYGALDAVEDVGAFFGAGNTFDATGGRPIGIIGYGADQQITATGYDDYIADATAAGGSTLHGLGGNDYLDGGAGADTLDGGTGNDILVGGSGTDTAVYSDTITLANLQPVADADSDTLGNQPGWIVTTATQGTDHITGVEIIDSAAAGNILLVGSGGFATIQAAVDAAHDGDTILVAAGTYVEQVVVNNIDNLTITAVAGDTVTIQAPADVVQTATRGSGQGVEAVLTAINSANLTVDHIHIDGAGAGNSVTPGDEFSGVYFRDSSGSLLSVDVAHVRDAYVGTTPLGDPAMNGTQRGRAVLVDNPAGQLAFTMTGGSISDFQKNGLVVNNADLDVSGVTITGGGVQQIAQNGIVVSNSTGTIDGNTIGAVGTSTASSGATGILGIGGNVGLDITDNIISGTNGADANSVTYGVEMQQIGFGANSGGHIGGNIIDHVDEGVGAYDSFAPGAVAIDGNSVTALDTTNDPNARGVFFDVDPASAAAFTIEGTGVQDLFSGGAGADHFTGLGGNDDFTGNGGNDTLTGGAGTDTAHYAGPRSGYAVTVATDAHGFVTGFTGVADTDSGNGDEGSDTLTSIEKLTFAGSTLDLAAPVQLLDAGGHLVGTFSTIQAAIDASEDDYTIRVAAGTYDEDLVINHGVSILGAEANVAVGGRDASGGTGETTILGHAQITATDNVTLNGLRFLNDTSTTAPTLEILTGGGATGHLVTDSIFWSTIAGGNVGDRAISTVVIAAGLVTITDNLISGTSHGQFSTASWDRGIWFDGGGVALVATGNTIEWSRTGLNLDMSGTSTANVTDNSFRGLGTGIAVGVDADGLTVSSNDIERVNEEFSFRNLSTDVTFDAGAAVGTVTPVGDQNDFIVVLGGSGNDTFTGTAGVDVLDGNNSGNQAAADNDVLNGMGGNDLLFGRAGNDTLDGGTGDDTLVGGLGNDIYYIDSAGDVITENANEGIDEVRTTLASYTLAADLENLTGLGNVDQTLNGNDANNVIDGGAGADHMSGGKGDDIYYVDNAGDLVTENTSEGTDEVRTTLASYTLGANVENLTGLGAIDQTLNGNDLNNVIDGGAGADHMAGGKGNDIYYVDNVGDVVTEVAGEGNDEVRTTLASYTLADNVETLTFVGTGNFHGTGNAGNNTIVAGAGNDVVDGAGGNDFIDVSQGGADTASGGAGTDAISFGATFGVGDSVDGGTGADTVGIRGDYTGANKLTITAGQMVNVETLSIQTANGGPPVGYDITWQDGNLANGQKMVIYGGNLAAGENVSFDGSAETHGFFVMYGGLGTDNFKGSASSDGFYFGPGKFTSADHVDGGGGTQNQLGLDGSYDFEASSALGTFGGNFTNIQSIILYTGTPGDPNAPFPNTYHIVTNDAAVDAGKVLTIYGVPVISNLFFDGSAELNGAFRILSGTGNDTLTGGHGNDIIFGNLGADTLTGGAGNDTFLYTDTAQSAGSSIDHITDFDAGDLIDLSQIDADTNQGGDQAFSFIGAGAFGHHAGELRATFDAGNNVWTVQGDTNGDGTADFTLLVTTQNGHAIVNTDFVP